MGFLEEIPRTELFVTTRSNQPVVGKVNRHSDIESYRVIRAAIIKVRRVLTRT